ncbi:hypothetical protein JCM18750_02500 [Halostagnicola bangensis]
MIERFAAVEIVDDDTAIDEIDLERTWGDVTSHAHTRTDVTDSQKRTALHVTDRSGQNGVDRQP